MKQRVAWVLAVLLARSNYCFGPRLVAALVALVALAVWPAASPPANGQSSRAAAEPAAASGVVQATPGLGGQWTVQQWAPLRVTFRDPGPVRSVHIFCDDAGPVFRATAVPPPAGESFLDLAVYPQVTSARWTVRLVRPDGRRQDFPLELKVRYGAPTEPADLAKQAGSDSVFLHPPWQMRLAAATWVRTPMENLGAAAFLATGRKMELLEPPDAVASVQLGDVFSPPDDSPLIGPGGEQSPFLHYVWADDLTNLPAQPIKFTLALLAGGLLAVVAIGVLLRRRWRAASVLTVLVLAAVTAAVWPAQPKGLTVRMELVIHAGGPVHAGLLGGPVRRQQWQCLAAYRTAEFDIPPTNPTPRILVAETSSRPNVVLPAAFTTEPPASGVARLARGDRMVGTTIEYHVDYGRMRLVNQPADGGEKPGLPGGGSEEKRNTPYRFVSLPGLPQNPIESKTAGFDWILPPPGSPGFSPSPSCDVVQTQAESAGTRITWEDWQVPVGAAYLVTEVQRGPHRGVRATALPAIGGEAGGVDVPAGTDVAWDTVYTAEASDPLDVRLRKRLLKYWTTSVIHGGRNWLIGFDPSPPRYEGGVLHVPAMYAIDLGAIDYESP